MTDAPVMTVNPQGSQKNAGSSLNLLAGLENAPTLQPPQKPHTVLKGLTEIGELPCSYARKASSASFLWTCLSI